MIMIPPTIPQIHPQELIAYQNTPTASIANATRTTSYPTNLIRPTHVVRSMGSSSGDSSSGGSCGSFIGRFYQMRRVQVIMHKKALRDVR